MKRWMVLGFLIALLAVDGAWAGGPVLQGRTVIAPDGLGADPLQGKDLILGLEVDQYPFPVTAVTLSAYSDSASDSGYLVATLLNTSYAETVDSVAIANGAVATFSGSWWRVNSLAFHGSRANVGTIRLYHGSPSPDSTLGIIPIGRRVAQLPYTQPEGRSELVPISWEVEATTTSPDSQAAGAIGIKIRRPGQDWELLDEMVFLVPGFPDRDYGWDPDGSWETRWPVPAGSDVQPAAGVTAAQTDITSRLQAGAR